MHLHPRSGLRPFACGVIALAAVLASVPSGWAAREKAPRNTTPASSKTQQSPPAKASASTRSPATPEFADAYPSARIAPSDLALSPEDVRKATALAYFAEGLLAEDVSDNDVALEKYQHSLDSNPASADLAVKVAFMLAQKGDPSGAIQVLKDAIQAAPKEPLPLIYLSQLYMKHLHKPELAQKAADRAVALAPDFFPGYLALFELAATQNQAAKVDQVLQRAAKAPSSDPEFWASLGELYTKVHLKENGSADSKDALRQMNAIFQKAADLGKEDAVILVRVGNYFVDSQQLSEAIPNYLAAVALKQDSEDPLLKNAREKLARALAQTGRIDEAIGILEQLTKDNSLDYGAFELLGELYDGKGDLENALANFRHSLMLDESEPRNHIRVITMELRLRHPEQAIDTAKEALARFPDSAEARYLLAIALGQTKRGTEAMTVFAEAENEFENDGRDDLLGGEFYFAYGVAADQAGLREKAAELLKKSIKIDPSRSVTYNYLGYMWTDAGEHLDEAGGLIKKAVEMEPENGAFLDSLGWYYYQSGDYQKALEELLRATKFINPEDATVYSHIGDTYQMIGNVAEALRYWEKALALNQEDADNAEIGKKVETAKQKVSSSASTPEAKAP